MKLSNFLGFTAKRLSRLRRPNTPDGPAHRARKSEVTLRHLERWKLRDETFIMKVTVRHTTFSRGVKQRKTHIPRVVGGVPHFGKKLLIEPKNVPTPSALSYYVKRLSKL